MWLMQIPQIILQIGVIIYVSDDRDQLCSNNYAKKYPANKLPCSCIIHVLSQACLYVLDLKMLVTFQAAKFT